MGVTICGSIIIKTIIYLLDRHMLVIIEHVLIISPGYVFVLISQFSDKSN